ncbi:excision repair cross-complementing rodent repair deficiency, complementation group 8 [Elysia marginata]|uniref:Excision repair cross-complementing rodent repair deficiency, complementation group 8 n=1 Tax=Elysia marginata TaxID=1093978 RepID=A0AAV4J227_9GAST|nr:excision repair cross-complementing rodent repair deficiency, complementation group 8 [Elysia marginata]
MPRARCYVYFQAYTIRKTLWIKRGGKGWGQSRYLPCRYTTHDGSVNGVEFTPSGHHLLTIGTDQKMYAWDTTTGQKLDTRFPKLSHIKRRSVKFCLTHSGSENFLFIPTGSSITSFGLSSLSKVRHMYGHYNNVNCTAFHGPRQQLLSGGNDHKILVWSVRGDVDYGTFLEEQRTMRMEKQLRQTVQTVDEAVIPIEVGQTESHLQDTWSDDDDDENEGVNGEDGKKSVDR